MPVGPKPRIVTYAREQTGDRAQDAAQENARRAGSAAANCPIVNGLPVTGVVLPAGAKTDVAHGLGRKWAGWLITRRYGTNPSAVSSEFATQTDTSRFITLTATADTTIDIWVY